MSRVCHFLDRYRAGAGRVGSTELDELQPVTIGTGAAIAFDDMHGGWWLNADGGADKNGRTVVGREPLEDGDGVDVDEHEWLRYRIETGRDALRDVRRLGAFVAVDDARTTGAYRATAFPADDPERHCMLVGGDHRDRPGDPPVLARWAWDTTIYSAYEVPRGLLPWCVAARARETGQPGDVALWAHLYRELLALRDRTALHIDDIVLSWDGAVCVRPAAAHREHASAHPLTVLDELEMLVQALDIFPLELRPQPVRYTGARGPAGDTVVPAVAAADVAAAIAGTVRGLFPDEWRAEQRLREELATLTPDAVDWLVERSAARAPGDRDGGE